jgi:hypothetical protein
MLEIFYSFIKRIVFWIVLFFSARVLFLVYYFPLLRAEKIGFRESIESFWYAIPLDIATSCYLLIIPFLLTLIFIAFRSNIILYFDQVYMLIVIAAFFLITSGELGVYEEWRTKLNYKALLYLKNPTEIYQSVSTLTFFILLFLLLFQISFWFIIYRRFFQLKKNNPKFKLLPYLAGLIVGAGLLFIGLRGGIDEIPINQSKSFYSRHNILNHAAVNSLNSFMISMLENFQFKNENPFQFMDQKTADDIVTNLLEVKMDTTVSILKINRPNIVVVLLEGWSADAIESLGGDTGITPNFKRL